MRVKTFTKGSKVRTLVTDGFLTILYVTEFGDIHHYRVSIASHDEQMDTLTRQMARDGYTLTDFDGDE